MPQRVCMLVRNDCRTDYRVLKEARSLARAGYAVTVIALNIYGPLEREERDGFQIIRVAVERHKRRAIRGFNLVPRALWRMAQAAAAQRADVYHAHDTDAIVPAGLAAWRVPGARLVYDAHEVGFLPFRDYFTFFPAPLAVVKWAWGQLNDRIVSRRAAAVISVNEVLADLQAEHYGISRPTVVMNCPPKPTASQLGDSEMLAERIGVAPGTPIVICQGMFSRERHGRGMESLVRSAALLREAVVVILGGGPQFEELRQLAAQPPHAGRVFVLPAVPPGELLAYTCGARIGVIPTEPWTPSLRYSSPNKLFEYVAAGLPVVTSDLPIIRQICEQYGCGLVCDPTSPESIAATIERILGDEQLYAALHAGALRAAEIYNWEHQERRLLALYGRLLGERVEARG